MKCAICNREFDDEVEKVWGGNICVECADKWEEEE